jgi:hypothetical protein
LTGSSTSSPFELERQAVNRLLSAGTFGRSPNLEKIIRYLCEQYFAGRAQGLKEYHVATEALGRGTDFDPKTDSIVRVEMHRLRRRLRQFYETNPDEPVQLVLPEKSYVPEFRRTEGRQLPAKSDPPDSGGNRQPEQPKQLGRRGQWWWVGATASTGAVALLLIAVLSTAPAPVAKYQVPEPIPDPVLAGPREEIRILAGRPPGRYIDRFGQAWEGDQYATGGTPVPIANDVATRGFDSNIFSGKREGTFRYDIPLKPGTYELMLLFAETSLTDSHPLGGEFHRIFHVEANGKRLLSEYDVQGEAFDANTATSRLFIDVAPAADGKLHLDFLPSTTGKPFLNGLILRPGVRGKIRPIRIVCRPQAFRDSENAVWEADRFFRGGVQITRPHGAPVEDSDLFRGERYGHFSYSIPVPPGRYSVRLYFWEYWWGDGHPGRGGRGSRVFDVFANHRPLLQNFDIIARNPERQYLIETFSGLEPNEQGQIVLDFQPRANYAMVNALEVFPEQ